MFYRKFSLITLCRDRWLQLAQSFVTWIAQDYPEIEHVVVVSGDDESPYALAQNEHFSGTMLRVRNAPFFRPSHYRNLAVSMATGEYLGFIDADMLMASSQWVSYCASMLKRRADLLVTKTLYDGGDSGGHSGSCAISRWLFEKIRGYNENLDECWGYEDTNLYIRAQRAGGRIASFPAQLLQHQPHGDEDRGRHFKRPEFTPRTPKVFIRQMRVCDHDEDIPPFEANRARRFEFPPETVTRIEQ